MLLKEDIQNGINNFLLIFINIVRKEMEFMPEGETPVELDSNPEILSKWCTNVAIQNVQKAAQIMRFDLHSEDEYRKEIHEFKNVLRTYKKVLKHSINCILNKKIKLN
jgi:hypothetical protein